MTAAPNIAKYYEAACEGASNPKQIANWVANELLGRLNASGTSIDGAKVSPAQLRDLVALIEDGTISGKIAKDVFDEMLENGQDADVVVEEKGLKQMSDSGELETICRGVIEKLPKIVEDYKGGKQKAFGALVGGVMKETRGKANPALVNEILLKVLS